MKEYTKKQILETLSAEFKESDGYKAIECPKFAKEEVYETCFLTSKPLVETNNLLKKYEDDGLKVLQNWLDGAASSVLMYEISGKTPYKVSVLRSSVDNPLNLKYKGSGYASLMQLVIDEGY